MAKKAKKTIKAVAGKSKKPIKSVKKASIKNAVKPAKKNGIKFSVKNISSKKPVKTANKQLKHTPKKALKGPTIKKIEKPVLNIKRIAAKKTTIPIAKPKKEEQKSGKKNEVLLKNSPALDKKTEKKLQNQNKKLIPKPPRVIVEKVVKELDIPLKATKKEPPGRFEIEYVVHTSPGILYEFLTTPSGLSEWFADDVNVKDNQYTFFWDGSQQQAKIIGAKDQKYIRYQWSDKNDGSYFEFKIEVDELTNDVSFIITDFAEGAEVATSKLLWDSQVNKLLHVIGAYF